MFKKSITLFIVVTALNIFSIDKFYLSTFEKLRLRDQPTLNGKMIRFIETSDLLKFIETGSQIVIDKINGRWIKVSTGAGDNGWCFDGYLTEVKKNVNSEGFEMFIPANWFI